MPLSGGGGEAWWLAKLDVASFGSMAGEVAALADDCEAGDDVACEDLSLEEEAKTAWMARQNAGPTQGALANLVDDCEQGDDRACEELTVEVDAKGAWGAPPAGAPTSPAFADFLAAQPPEVRAAYSEADIKAWFDATYGAPAAAAAPPPQYAPPPAAAVRRGAGGARPPRPARAARPRSSLTGSRT